MIRISRLCLAFFSAAILVFCRSAESAPSGAQDAAVPAELRLAERLLNYGDAEAAAVEYRRYLTTRPEGAWTCHVWQQLAEALVQQGKATAAGLALRAAERAAPGAQERENARLRGGMVAMGAGDYPQASLAFITLNTTTEDPVMRARSGFLAGMSALQQAQWGEARRLFARTSPDPGGWARPSAAARLDSLLDAASVLPSRSPDVARWLSTFVPGAGQFYSGDFWNGLNALVLNGLTGWLMVRSAQTREWDEFALTATLLFGRYYLGNRYQAGVRAERFNRLQVERVRREATRLAKDMVGAESDP